MWIAKSIPKFPNNKRSLQALEKQSLGSLLIHYANWAFRYVPIRPREVQIENTASNDPRWSTLSDQVFSFLEKVKEGEDLTPHLSLLPHTKGYFSSTYEDGQDINRWADKDFLLNVMGYHHFHLGFVSEKDGYASRTKEVLFAHVSREKFVVIGLFNHSVFDQRNSSDTEMSKERKRLWSIFDKHSTNSFLTGMAFIPSFITTSGHRVDSIRIAQEYARVVQEVDPLLDDYSYVLRLYQTLGIQPPKKRKLEWTFNNLLDLGLLDKAL